MRILVDRNLSPAWVPLLSRAGHEALHWSSVGRPDAPDADLVRWAIGSAAIGLTNDLDFSAILAASGERVPSVLQLRMQNLLPDAAGPTVLPALTQFEQELTDGALVSLDPERVRARLLPLRR